MKLNKMIKNVVQTLKLLASKFLLVSITNQYRGARAITVTVAILVGPVVMAQVSKSTTQKARNVIKINPSFVKTYPGYQTVFTTDRADSSTIAWYFSGSGSIQKNQFLPSAPGKATVLAFTPTEQAVAQIEVLPANAVLTARTIADFDEVIPTATQAMNGLWQVFNAGGQFIRIVDNPSKDQINPSARCVEMDRSYKGASHGFATKQTLLIGGEHTVIEMLIRGENLTEFKWKAQAQLGAENAGYSDKREVEGETTTIIPGKWNKVTIDLTKGTGLYLRYVSMFANPNSKTPMDIFQVDQVRWVVR
jgi:hypothetical protein